MVGKSSVQSLSFWIVSKCAIIALYERHMKSNKMPTFRILAWTSTLLSILIFGSTYVHEIRSWFYDCTCFKYVKDFSKLNVKCQNETSESNSKSFSLHSFMFNNSFDVKSYVYNLQEIQKYNYVLTQEISYQKSSKQDKLIVWFCLISYIVVSRALLLLVSTCSLML